MSTRERNKIIVERVRAGESMVSLAKRYGITRQRVEQIARGYFVPKAERDKALIEKEKETILALRREGRTYEEIMEHYGLSFRACHVLTELFGEHGLTGHISFFGEVGQKFGEWEITDNRRVGEMNRFVVCACSCGRVKLVAIRNLVEGKSKQCHACAIAPGKRKRKQP